MAVCEILLYTRRKRPYLGLWFGSGSSQVNLTFDIHAIYGEEVDLAELTEICTSG